MTPSSEVAGTPVAPTRPESTSALGARSKSVAPDDRARFDAALAGAERRANRPIAERHPSESRDTDDTRRGAERTPSRTADIDEDKTEEPRERQDGGLPFGASAAPVTMASSAGGDWLGSITRGADAALEGPLTAARIATLVERLDALSSSATQSARFRVIDGLPGVESLQLVRGEAGWRVQLGLERGARASLRGHLAELEDGLVSLGLSVDAVQLDERGEDARQ